MSKEKESESKKSTNKKNSTTQKKNTTKKNTDTKQKNNTKTKDTKKNIEEKKNNKKVKEVEKEVKIEVVEDEFDDDIEFDEDLEDSYEEEVIEVKPTKKESPKKEKNISKNDSKDVSKENIKKIEKIAKEKKKVNKNNKSNSKIKDFGYFLEDHRNIISSFVAGVLVTTLVAFIIWPDRIATLKNGTQPVVSVGGKTYTANDLYDQMKSHYSVSQLLDAIDNDLLTKLYPENEEMTKEVESNAEYYINMYKQYYNYTEEQFLSANGFASRNAYLEYLKLDYRRKKYQDEYIEKNLTDDEIQKYYDENVYGDINCQHILVEVASDDSSSDDKKSDSNKLSDEDAKKLAQEIIDKINDGTSWKDIQNEYKDKVTYEDLGYQSWDSDLEDSFKTALKDMEDKSYSDEPVKTSYGYHVIYRIDQKKAPSLKKTKDKIIEKLIEKKTNEDSNILYKALISLRKDKNIKFSDTDMKEKYDNYIKQYNK